MNQTSLTICTPSVSPWFPHLVHIPQHCHQRTCQICNTTIKFCMEWCIVLTPTMDCTQTECRRWLFWGSPHDVNMGEGQGCVLWRCASYPLGAKHGKGETCVVVRFFTLNCKFTLKNWNQIKWLRSDKNWKKLFCYVGVCSVLTHYSQNNILT